MRSSVTSYMTMAWLCVAALLGGMALHGVAVARNGNEYEISVEPYKSDNVRLIEAYERLSDRYLSLVQHHLKNMDAADKEILNQLQKLEKKIDDLSAKVDKLAPVTSPAVPAQ